VTDSIVVETIAFSNGHIARAVHAPENVDVSTILSALDLGSPRALAVITGGASGMSEDEINRVRPLLAGGLARLAAEEHIAILDGGTNAGVMALIGEGATAHRPTAPIIGPRTLEQLEGAMRALDTRLADETLGKLDEIWPGLGGEAPEAYA
jgi:hypothetical protein